MNTTNEHETMSFMAEVQLSYKAPPERNRWSITCPEDAYGLLLDIWNDNTLDLKESFYVILLDNSKNCIGWSRISDGGRTAAIVDVSHVAVTALLANAHSVLLGHNHPSGCRAYSAADINLTKRIKEALKILGITLEDHILVTREGFESMRTQGLI